VTTSEEFRVKEEIKTWDQAVQDIKKRTTGVEEMIVNTALMWTGGFLPITTAVVQCAFISCESGAVLGAVTGPLAGPFASGIGRTVFRTSHYAGRLERVGLNPGRVESIIGSHIEPMRHRLAANADFRGRVQIDDVLVEYRARLRSDGTVSVGTIFPVR
jgi:hypothetical protein